MEYKDPGRYIPIIYLLYSWGSHLGFPVESVYRHCDEDQIAGLWSAISGSGFRV